MFQPHSLQQLSLTIHGEVQGVGFRWFIVEQARRLKLNGWVKNTPNGNIELLAQGDEKSLRILKTQCQKGPDWARITKIEEDWKTITETGFEDFTIAAF